MNSDSFWELLEHFGQLFESYWEPWLWTCLWPCKSAQEAGVAAEWTHLSGFQPNQLPVTADEEEELAILGKGEESENSSSPLNWQALLFSLKLAISQSCSAYQDIFQSCDRRA